MRKINRILIINGSRKSGASADLINDRLCAGAYAFLQDLDLEAVVTDIRDGYDLNEEILKFLWCDAVIWQFPIGCTGEPWPVKKYLEELLQAGAAEFLKSSDVHAQNAAFSRLAGKSFFISGVFHAKFCPFDEQRKDENSSYMRNLLFHLYNACACLGMEALPEFSCNETSKADEAEQCIESFKAHLKHLLK